MKKWLNAARLRTLPLSVSGILLGCGLGKFHQPEFKNFWLVFILCLLTTLLFQIISNFANDYGDAEKGTDNDDRIGPKRAIQSGSIQPKQMKNAMIFLGILSMISSILIIYFSFGASQLLMGIFYFVLAIVSIYAAIKYTVGNSAYGYRGLGDIFVFIFFGLVSSLGSYYLITKRIDMMVILAGIMVGAWSTAVLNMNNMRDIDNDAAMNKNTLVVQLGLQRARIYHIILIIVGIVNYDLIIYFLPLNSFKWLLLLLIFPFLINIKVALKAKNPLAFDPELKRIAITTFMISLILTIILFNI